MNYIKKTVVVSVVWGCSLCAADNGVTKDNSATTQAMPAAVEEKVSPIASTPAQTEKTLAGADEKPAQSLNTEKQVPETHISEKITTAPENKPAGQTQADQHASDKKTTVVSSEKKHEHPITERTLNEIRAVVYGSGPLTDPGQTVRPTETVLITTQDTISPWLDGKPRTLRELILEQLMIFDAQKLNQSIPDEEIDKLINQLQKNNNMTREQLESQIAAMGFTLDEFREQLGRKQLVDRIVDYRVHADKRMAVSQADIEAYWQKSCPMQEATFVLASATIKTAENRSDFEQKLHAGAFEKIITWNEPITVKQSELSKEKQFIADKNTGDIVFIEPVEDGFEITKLVSKTAACKIPLKTGNKEEDKAHVDAATRALKQQRFIQVMDDYQDNLLKNAKIDFTYASDREAVLNKKA